jgi:hypothetical protein
MVKHRMIMLSVGDGLCCGLEEVHGYSSQLDWGRSGSPEAAVNAYKRFIYNYGISYPWVDPISNYLASGFPNAFVLSHYHADHYNGLMNASQAKIFQRSWRGLSCVLLPGIPEIPDLSEDEKLSFYLALFALNALKIGSETGHMDYDFLRALGRLSHRRNFAYRRLFQDDQFNLGRLRYECLWPPRTITDTNFGVRVRRAVDLFQQALEEHPELRYIHDRIGRESTFKALMSTEENKKFAAWMYRLPLMKQPLTKSVCRIQMAKRNLLTLVKA